MRSTSFGSRFAVFAVSFFICAVSFGQKPGEIVLKQASTHPMHYYVSLPTHWKKGGTYPVVVAIESADRDFKKNAEDFVAARHDLSMILVIPEVITNGGSRYREATGYSYSESDWARVATDGGWKFDQDGLDAVISDVHRDYGGESSYFLTGWEAGGHTVFAMAFDHPEKVRAVAPVCPNYQGRNISFSSRRVAPPIRVFAGDRDAMWGQGNPLFDQTKRAEADGKAHGFQFSYEIVKGKGHGPLAEAVLAWFNALSTTS